MMKNFDNQKPSNGQEIRLFINGNPNRVILGTYVADRFVDAIGNPRSIQPGDCWDTIPPNLVRPTPKPPKPAEAKRYNEGKAKLSYFARSFPKALECIARVKELGAVKYEDGNWRLGNKPDTEYLDSHDRHMLEFIQGRFYDEDSGCAHLGHAIWNLCALFELNYGEWPVIDKEVFSERIQHWSQKRVDGDGNSADSNSIGQQRCCQPTSDPSSRGIDNEFCLGTNESEDRDDWSDF